MSVFTPGARRTEVSRRRALWLLAAGAGLVGLPGARRAHAAAIDEGGPVVPRRFVGVFTPHGVVPQQFRPGPGFDLRVPGCTLAPFDAFRDRLLVLEGLDLAAGIESGTTGHDGSRVLLTGAPAGAASPSLDQYLAIDCQLGADTPHATIALGIGTDDSGIGVNVSYSRDGTPAPKLIEPGRTFAALFGSALSGASARELEAERRRGRSALDAANGELARLRTRAPAAERDKLEQHAHALREVEKRITRVELSCTPPPSPPSFTQYRSFGGGERDFEEITRIQIDLLVHAMRCDLTRFATLYLADLSRSGVDPELPLDIHIDVAHRYDASRPETWRPLARQHLHSYGQVAELVRALEAAALLDDTLVWVSSDMGDPARHSSRDVPTLLLGARAFAMGRHLDLKALETPTRRGLVPNNRLLVSLARAFGAPIDRFGFAYEPDVTQGPLQSL